MAGPIGLIGSGEFGDGAEAIDRALLAATGRRRPRVALVPTALAPFGDAELRRRCEMGRQYLTALGAEVEAVDVRGREEADDPARAQAIGEADLVWLTAGMPDHLERTLAGTAAEHALRAAHARGAVIAGCDASAAALGAHRFVLRRRPWPVRWRAGLALVPGAAVAAHYDALPEPVVVVSLLRAPRGEAVVGIDRATALVGRDGWWQVIGQGRVTIWRGRHRERYRPGDAVHL